MSMPRKDLTGQKFNMLTVLHAADVPGYWVCKCDCGKTSKPLLGYSLRSGNTRSCGCLRRGLNKVRAVDDGRGADYNKYKESDKRTELSNTPRETKLASDLLRGHVEVLSELIELMRDQGIEMYIKRGEPIYYKCEGRWFGEFETPIEAMGHALYNAFGTKHEVEIALQRTNSPYARYRGLHTMPEFHLPELKY